MRLSDDRLRSALRAEAEAHRPDRDAMLGRITAATMRETGRGRAGLPVRGPRVRTAAVVTGSASTRFFSGSPGSVRVTPPS